jgi:hypothetical protein
VSEADRSQLSYEPARPREPKSRGGWARFLGRWLLAHGAASYLALVPLVVPLHPVYIPRGVTERMLYRMFASDEPVDTKMIVATTAPLWMPLVLVGSAAFEVSRGRPPLTGFYVPAMSYTAFLLLIGFALTARARARRKPT